MPPLQPGSDEGLARLLGSLRRHPAPDVPVEAIFERWRLQLRRRWALAGFATAASLMVAVLLPPAEREAPVHLQLRVIDVAPAEAESATARSAFGESLEEAFGP